MDSNDKSDAQPIDAEEQPVQSAGQEEATAVEEQPVEQEQVETTEEPVDEPVQEEETQEESPQVSKRENLRIQALVEKMKRQGQPTPQQGSQEDRPEALNYAEQITADEDVIKTLESDRENYGKSQFERGRSDGVKQAESIQFHTRLELDAPKVATKYPQLDKDSENFNPPVANALNSWYLATAGYDPETKNVDNADIRYYDFVDGIMELADVIASEKSQESAKNIAKQASQTSVRPDGSKAKRLNLNKAPQDMTDEELDAFIASKLK